MTKKLMTMMIGDARDSLARTAQAVPDDKLNWRPLDAGRSALDLLGDAAQTPKMIAMMLESRGEIAPSREMFQQMKAERENWTRDDALSHLQQNCDRLLPLIEALPDEELAREITLPMGGGMTYPMAIWIMMTYRTLTNRFAQINYLQTLYGDNEPH